MTPDQIAAANAELRHQSPLDIVRWAIAQAGGRAIVSTNFRPYEAVVLHLATQVQPDIPVLWVDHGYNRDATYRHAEQLLTATATELSGRRKSRAIVLGNLTLALIRQGEVEAAVESLGRAIEELERTRGGGGMNIVFRAARELRPWRQHSDVQDVQDRLLSLMAAA